MVAEPKPRPPVDRETGEIPLTDEQLIDVIAASDRELEDTQKANGIWHMQAQERITENGGTTLYGRSMDYVMTTKNETDWSKMPPVLEFLTPEEKAEAFTPEHTITVPAVPEHDAVVPDKWAVKGTITKLARRHGDEALAAIEDATFPGKVSGKLVRTET